MTEAEVIAVSEARSAYDKARGAVSGSDYTGFLLAVVFGFWMGDMFPDGSVPNYVITLGSGLAALTVVRTYYARALRSAEDAYYRLAKLGKYAETGHD